MVFLAGVSPFLIFFAGGMSILDDSMAFREELHFGALLRGSSLVSLTLIIPLLLDALINAFNNQFGSQGGHNPSTSTRDILTTSETIIFHVAMMLPVIMPFLPNTSRSPSMVYSFTCAHEGMVYGIFLTSIFRFSDGLCHPLVAMLLFLLLIASNALKPYVYSPSVIYGADRVRAGVDMAASVTSYGAVALFLVVLLRCIARRVWKALVVGRVASGSPKPAAAKASSLEDHREVGHMRFHLAYKLCILFWIFFKIGVIVNVNNSGTTNFSKYGDYEMFLYNIPSIVFQFFFLMLSMRMVRFDAIAALITMITAKKEYVRYIRCGC